MGTLTMPATRPIYLDTSGFIDSVERIEPYRTLLEPMWREAQAGQFVIVRSELVNWKHSSSLFAKAIQFIFGLPLFGPEDQKARRIDISSVNGRYDGS
ncbi:MAG: hypothetical protein OEU26_11430 [Candidatus Tectomicrobia bacterium]|nr:hypothetical protein [Candidatus Tectomicrobia bacterium]